MISNDFEILHLKSSNYSRRSRLVEACAGYRIGGDWDKRKMILNDEAFPRMGQPGYQLRGLNRAGIYYRVGDDGAMSFHLDSKWN